MIFFLDASSLAKLYLREKGSQTVRALLGQSELATKFFTSDHIILEVSVTLSKRARSSPRRDRRAISVARERFLLDQRDYLNVVTVSSDMVAVATELAEGNTDSGVGTLDLLHLAAATVVSRALPLEDLIFVSSDRKLLHLVRRRGFEVFNPEDDRLSDLPRGFGI